MPYIDKEKQQELQELQQLYDLRIRVAKYNGLTLGLGIAAIIFWGIQVIGWLLKGNFPLALMLLGGLVIFMAFLIPCYKDFTEK